MTQLAGLPLARAFTPDMFVLDRLDPGGDVTELFSKIVVTSYQDEIFDPGPGGRFELGLSAADEIVLGLVGLEGFALVLGGPSSTLTTLGVSMWPNRLELRLEAGARLRFPRSMLKPVRRDGDQWVDDPTRPYAEVLVSAGIVMDQDGDVTFDGANAFHLDAAMIGDSGFVIEGDIALDLSELTGLPESAALGLPPSWRGIVFRSLNVYLPEALVDVVPVASLAFTNFHIGSGGVTGSVALTGTPGDGTIGGFPFRPTSLEVELRQNCLVRAETTGRMTLPFFDAPLDLVVGFDLAGNLHAALRAGSDPIKLNKPGVLSLVVDGIAFAVEDHLVTVAVSGTMTPQVAGLDWPGIRVEGLSVDSRGGVHLAGGWLRLPRTYEVDFHGFGLEIARLGFGNTQDGGKWVGFSGGVHLMEGMPAGASVDGLRVTWYDDGSAPRVTLDGVGVEFEIPDVLRFAGAVSYQGSPDGVGNRFAGAVKVQLLALDLEVDASLVIGSATDEAGGYGFAGAYLSLELPAGIPLGSTGLALYGMAGLAAVSMEPKKEPEEDWYEDWYHRAPVGVTDVSAGGKWRNQRGSFALGAGVTIGTASDNGHLFSGKFLLLIVLPGPVIMLDGKANLLKDRAKLNASEEPMLRSLAVLDGRAGTLSIGLDARYRYAEKGELVDIQGSSHAFFDFNDPDAWYLDIGRKEPESDRVRARLFRLFDASSYFMLSADGVELGARVEFRPKPWKLGPLEAGVEAWLDSGAAVSPKPAHFSGYLHLHGSAWLKAFGYGVVVTADAQLAAEVFDPYHIKGSFSATLGLPWPLKDISHTFELEWGPEPAVPPIPVLLKEIAVEHFKSTASWPLAAGTLLVPELDRGDGFLRDDVSESYAKAPPPPNVPVVPLDARPRLTFTRPVHDDARIGFNWQAQVPEYEWVGDPRLNQGPLRVRYALSEIRLDKWVDSQWQTVAARGGDPVASARSEVTGSWAPVRRLPETDTVSLGHTKLWLWSRTPFDYLRWTSRGYDQSVIDGLPHFPLGPDSRSVWDFASVPPGPLPAEFRHPDNNRLVFSTDSPDGLAVEEIPGGGGVRVLRFPLLGSGHIGLPWAANDVRLALGGARPEYFVVTGSSSDQPGLGVPLVATLSGDTVEIRASDGPSSDLAAGRAGDGPAPLRVRGVRVVLAPLGTCVPLAEGLSGIRDCQYVRDGRHLLVAESDTGQIRYGRLAALPAHWAEPLLAGDAGSTDLSVLLRDYRRPQRVIFQEGAAVMLRAEDVWHSMLYVLEADGGLVRHPVTVAPDGPLTVDDPWRSSAELLCDGLVEPRNMDILWFSEPYNTHHWVVVAQATPTNTVVAVRVPVASPGQADRPLHVFDHMLEPMGLAWGAGTGDWDYAQFYLTTPATQQAPRAASLSRLAVSKVDGGFVAEPYAVLVGVLQPTFLHRRGRALIHVSGGDVHQLIDGSAEDGGISRRVLLTDSAWSLSGAMHVDGGTGANSRMLTWSDSEIGLYELPPVAGPYTGQCDGPWQRRWDWRVRVIGYDAGHNQILISTPGGIASIEAPENEQDPDPSSRMLVHNPPSGGACPVADPTDDLLYLIGPASLIQLDVRGGPVDYAAPGQARREFALPFEPGTRIGTQLAWDRSGTVLCALFHAAYGSGAPRTSVVRLRPADPSATAELVYDGDCYGTQLLVNSDGTGAYLVTGGNLDPDRLLRVDFTTGLDEVVADPFLSTTDAAWLDTGRTRLAVAGHWRRPAGEDNPPLDLVDMIHVVDVTERPVRPKLLLHAYRDADEVERWPSVSRVLPLPGDRLLVCSRVAEPGTGRGGLDEVRVYKFPGTLLRSITRVDADEVVERLEEEIARWKQPGEILEPNTIYRLAVGTEVIAHGAGEIASYHEERRFTQYGYFRTEGPPGMATLTPPDGHPAGSDYRNGLEDLSRYVARTVPPAPPATGEPSQHAPGEHWYRSYDIGVVFNENYVDLMYREQWRDLAIHLYDGNGPARDDDGALLALANRWGTAEEVALHRTETTWLRILDGTGEASLSDPQVQHSTRAVAPVGTALAPLTRYDARLVPLLLHDDFSQYHQAASGPDGRLGRWYVHDLSGRSNWMAVAEADGRAWHLTQTGQAASMLLVGDDATAPASDWSDYRLSAYLRPAPAGVVGLVFRHGEQGHYRYVIGAGGSGRRLERVLGADVTVLAEDDRVHHLDRDYLVVVQAVGTQARVFEEGAAPLVVTDDPGTACGHGRVGLYCVVAGDPGRARFTDIRVNDYRPDAPDVYKFAFTTSGFANFQHHLHSHDDGVDRAELDGSAPTADWFAAAGPTTSLPSDDEKRGYAALVQALGGDSEPGAVRVSWVERGSETVALLVRGPEPMDWARVSMAVARAADPTFGGTVDPALVLSPPGDVKIIAATIANTQPNQETVTVLLRQALDLTGCRVEYRLPGGDWLPYHRFGAEQRRPAGTRFRLYAGNPADAPPDNEPDVLRRYLATGDDPGTVRLGQGALLRIVRDGRVGHEYLVLAGSGFARLPGTRVLRGGDGKGFALVVPDPGPAGSRLPVGRYRLSTEYRRDNRAVDPDSPVFTSAGHQYPEQVTIDVPWEPRPGSTGLTGHR